MGAPRIRLGPERGAGGRAGWPLGVAGMRPVTGEGLAAVAGAVNVLEGDSDEAVFR